MSLNSSQWQILVSQVQAATVSRLVPKGPGTPNPRPPGVIRHGSATHAVVELLRSCPQERFTCFQLMRYTGRTHAAVSHACLYLRGAGLIVAFGGLHNPQYLQYQISKVGHAKALRVSAKQ